MVNCYAYERQNVFNSATKYVESKSILILTRLSIKNEKKKVLDYFHAHQSKTAHAFIVNFSTILASFIYAEKSRAVLKL